MLTCFLKLLFLHFKNFFLNGNYSLNFKVQYVWRFMCAKETQNSWLVAKFKGNPIAKVFKSSKCYKETTPEMAIA